MVQMVTMMAITMTVMKMKVTMMVEMLVMTMMVTLMVVMKILVGVMTLMTMARMEKGHDREIQQKRLLTRRNAQCSATELSIVWMEVSDMDGILESINSCLSKLLARR